MPFGLDLDDIRDLNPFDDDEKKPKRKKPKRPEKVPRTTKKKEEDKRDDSFLGALKTLATPGAMFAEVARPIAKYTHAPAAVGKNIEHIAEMGAGLLPAAKTVGKMGYRDIRRLTSGHHDMPTRKEMSQYFDLLKYGWEDDPKKGKKRPKSDSEIVGLVGEMLGMWGRGIEKAIPQDPTSRQEWRETRKAWTDDLVLTLLDVIPVGSLASRPLSAAKLARNIGKANDISRGKAIAAGVRESYRPGSAARGKIRTGPKGEILDTGQLKGGIEPRTHTYDFGGEGGRGVVEVGGRPWSRIPLMRAIQRGTDSAYKLSPSMQRKRVGRHEQRLDAEETRRVKLSQSEMERPIGELLYGAVGRTLGAFGLKRNMSAKERRIATGLAYTTQMPKWMDPSEALASIQDDLSAVLQSGKIEIPKGRGRTKSVNLTPDEKQNLAIQIGDLDIVRKELDDGDLSLEEWKAAQEAMGDIAGKTHEMGLDVMQRRYDLDADEMEDLAALWKRRSEIIPRRLVANGRLAMRDVSESGVRQGRLEELTELLGPEEARALVALTDARARAVRPHDPASYWDDRIGSRTDETAEEYVARMGDEALFPQMDEGTTLVDALLQGMERNLLDTDEFYSPLQKWIDEEMPDKMTAAQMRGTLKSDKSPIPKEEYDNVGLDMFFAGKDPQEIIYKTELQEHMALPINANSLREILLSNADEGDHMFGSIFDKEHGANYMSRDPRPGEYFELLLQLPGPPIYKGNGWSHWERPNIAAHVRFHIFEEDGVRKMLIEEIQSDWGNEWRKARAAGKEHRLRTSEEQAAFEEAQTNYDEVVNRYQRLRQRNVELARRQDEAEKAGDIELRDQLDMEWYENRNELDSMQEDVFTAEQGITSLNDEFGLTDVARAPLGTGISPKSSYLNPTIRWLIRRADETEVDEIHLVARETQLVRNREVLDDDEWEQLTQTMDARGAEGVTEYVRELLKPQRRKRKVHEQDLPEEELEITGPPMYEGRSFLGYEHDLPNIIEREMGVAGRKVDDGYDGTYRHPDHWEEDGVGRMPSTVFRMTDEAKARSRKPKSMYQRQPNWKGLPHGAAELLDKGTRIHMFETGNISTWIHELGHVGLYDLDAADLAIIETHVGGGFKLGDWTTMEHERFARSWEQYVRKGHAPNKELAAVFSKLSAWMKAIWREAKVRKSEDIPDEVRDVFDRMLKEGADEGDEFSTFGYFPHRDIEDEALADYRGGVRTAATGQVVGGMPRETGVTRKGNEMLLYQTGRMNPDPGGLVNTFLNRLRFQVTLDAREAGWNRGHTMDEEIPKGTRVMLIRNPHAPPERIRPGTKAAARGQRLERPVEDDLENMLRMEPEAFRKEIIAKHGEKPEWRDDYDDIRWIEEDYMMKRFGEAFEEKPRGKGWSAMSLLTSLQRTTGIYGRPISYVGGNVPFNVMALVSQMPVSTLRNMSRALDIRKNDPKLWRGINSESGETRASGGLPERYIRPQNEIQALEQSVTAFQRGAAEKLSSVADDPFRTVAFLNNARKMGYKTNADLRRLIEEDGTDLKTVRQQTREQMLDFDALNPAQRRDRIPGRLPVAVHVRLHEVARSCSLASTRPGPRAAATADPA